ncbi:BREX-2 system phosphatase PglZ [Parafrankia sp. EUN1f]|uniref:BREX-2 system phosphatase PglZ n=1 Tax=Parafrankia sp. EUN1f TaxID=102897 RepID=UPI0001C4565A|nr:BREX-2 system phosphatase PglZ [Parafrankia sp. EUN1f]EFC82792.1 PglZ domain protein [Parafrankia sp. EUN1f]
MTVLPSSSSAGHAAPSGMSGAGAPRVTPAIVLGRVARLRRGGHSDHRDQPRVLLVRARPEWSGPADLDLGGRPVRVVACVSPLAVLEEVVRWTHAPVEDGWLVLLTDADEESLGDSLLAQVHRQRVDVIEPWLAVLEDFGATQADPRLRAPEYRWVAPALLEARPAAGWPRRPGGLLGREDALAELAAARLGLTELGLGAADLDIATLLRWTTTPGATAALGRLGDDERAGVTRYLVERTGRAGQALFTLTAAGNGDRALALGLVCDCLWPRPQPAQRGSAEPPAGTSGPGAGPGSGAGAGAVERVVERARVRVERYFGDVLLDDVTMRAFADAVHEVVTTALLTARPGAGSLGVGAAGGRGATEDASVTLHPDDGVPALLDTADRLLGDLDARAAGAASDILRSGFDHRLGMVAGAVRDFLAAAESGVHRSLLARAARDVMTAVGSLRGHLLAGLNRPEVERAAMAARLVGWLATQPTGSLTTTGAPATGATAGPTSLAAALDAHLDDGAWADIALSHLAAGTPAPVVGSAYGDLYLVVARRRRALDAAFARLLAQWTTTGRPAPAVQPVPAGPAAPLCVEDVLDRVVRPVVTARGGRALLLVLDGMSAAVAAQLAAELRRERWEECDPLGLPEADPAGSARRRAALAVLPTVTTTSRTSLLAGRLVTGDKTTEKTEFENHPRWGRRPTSLFHHADLAGAPGVALDGALTDALTSDIPLVAVVINTIDDMLDRGRPHDDGGWSLADVGRLRAVLGYARTAGRAVILTSDHGHVVDHRAERLTPAADAEILSARHRACAPGEGEGVAAEVLLAGPRVLAPGGRIVALWDPDTHYLGRHGGYHGGASPAEVTVPVLAFLPFRLSAASTNRHLPPGWRPLPDQRPRWWSLETTDLLGGLDSLAGGETVLLGRPASSAALAASAASAATAADGGAEATVALPRKRRRPAEEQTGPALFDLPAAATGGPSARPSADPAAGGAPEPGARMPGGAVAGASVPGGAAADEAVALGATGRPGAGGGPADPIDVLVAGLLASELFRSQLDGLARKVPVEKVEAAVRALLGANGTLATSVVAARAGERPVRAGGFAVTLRRLFNIDNYPVLEPIDDGHTLRLNVDLLRAQFGLAV